MVYKYLQPACLIMMVAGVAVEVVTGAEVGYVLITAGSIGFAAAAKLEARYWRHKRFFRR